MIKLLKQTILTGLLLLTYNNIFAITSFSGISGANLNYSADPEKEKFEPNMNLKAFFAGQFNFTPNLWSHLEFSIDTANLISEDVFKKTSAKFKIDEVSLTIRTQLNSTNNYFSCFLGTYEPIGSDILLQRYFGIEPIASKITESWLGIGNSNLYQQIGTGIADLIKFNTMPTVFGAYFYVNHEDEENYVFNTDLRGACYFHYFTCDTAIGLGAPLSNEAKAEDDVVVTIDKLYWHAGTTILLGNNYTQSLFIQAGLNNASFKPQSNNISLKPENCYFLIEPRFLINNAHFNISLYNIPKDTVEDLLFIDNALGVNFNMYKDNIHNRFMVYTFGTCIDISQKDKLFNDVFNFSEFVKDKFYVTVSPYFSTNFLNGEIHALLKIITNEFNSSTPQKALSVNIGYKGRL